MRSKRGKLPLSAPSSSLSCWTKTLSPGQIAKDTLASLDEFLF